MEPFLAVKQRRNSERRGLTLRTFELCLTMAGKHLFNRQETGSRDKRGRFAPGQSGNPRGRPAEPESFTAQLRDIGADEVTIDSDAGPVRVTRLRALALRLFELADAGSVRAFDIIAERLEGRAPQSVSLAVGPAVMCIPDFAEIAASMPNAAETAEQEARLPPLGPGDVLPG